MSKIKKILMPTDFSENANQALRYGARMADLFDAELTLFHVISIYEEDPYDQKHKFPDLKAFNAKLEVSAMSKMETYAPHLENIKVQQATARSISPADEVLKFARENDFDLIVMGTHGRSAITHFLLGSVAENVVRHATCPVITVSHEEDEMFDYPEINKIVVPLDFSEHSYAALPFVANFAKSFGAEVHFVHIVDQRIHPAYYVMGEQSILQIFPDIMKKSDAKLREFASDALPSNIKVATSVREGSPHSEIIKYANKEKAGLIMMATHGLSGLEKLLIGSTAEKVVRKASCPVFTVKPETE